MTVGNSRQNKMTVGVPFPAPSPLSYAPKKPKPPNTNQLSKTQNHEDALLLYVQTLSQRLLPHKPTLISSIKSCSLASAISEGRPIHAHVVKFGLGSDRFVGSSLVWFYSACGFPNLGRRVFDGMHEKDEALYTAMVVGYAKNGDVESARNLFDEMPERDVVAWNAMLSGYARCGFAENALELFRDMQLSGVRPNEITLVSVLSACSQLGCLALGEWIHAYIERDPEIRPTLTLNNSIVHMYAKCGRLDVAFRMFIKTETKNLESWNTMLTGLAIHGCGIGAVSLFSQMIKTGVIPDRITFVGLLMACSHAGTVEHARRCFDCMSWMYGIEPRPEHYGCMVDVLSRWGRLEEAYRLIKTMPFEADAYGWGALLGGCYTHCSYELGLEAAQSLLELHPWDEGRYIALSNLYTLNGRQADAMKVRKKMIDMDVKKSSGSSSIEVDGVVHEFIAGDRSHYRSKDIYSMIEFICRDMESQAYARKGESDCSN